MHLNPFSFSTSLTASFAPLCSIQSVQATDVARGRKAAFAGGPGGEQEGNAEKYEGGASAAGPPEGCRHLG